LVVIQQQYVATLEVRHSATPTRPACMVRFQALLLKVFVAQRIARERRGRGASKFEYGLPL
jgi:hypothetical protein